jgi:hypothetical protein
MAYTQEEILKLVEDDYIRVYCSSRHVCCHHEDDSDNESWGHDAPARIEWVMMYKPVDPNKILDLNLLESSKYTFDHIDKDELCVRFYYKFNMDMRNIIFPNNTKIFDLKHDRPSVASISTINMPSSVKVLKLHSNIPLMSLRLPDNITYNFPIDNFPKSCTHLTCRRSPLVSFKGTNIRNAKVEYWMNNVLFPKLDELIIYMIDAPIHDNQIKNVHVSYYETITTFNITGLERLVISKPSAPLVDLPPTLKYIELGTKKYTGRGFMQLVAYGCGDVTIQGYDEAEAAIKPLTKEEIIERSRFPSGCEVVIHDF